MDETKVVGRGVPRIDAPSKVTGQAFFPGYLSMPGMLHIKILFSERAHARILQIDTSRAEMAPGVVAIITAMEPGTPQVHLENDNTNICVHDRILKGDVEIGFTLANVIIASEYRLPFQEHAYLQPEAGLAYLDEEGRVTVQAAGQWPHTDRAQIAYALGLHDEQMRVIYSADWKTCRSRSSWPWRRGSSSGLSRSSGVAVSPSSGMANTMP